jgi:elongation factor 1 alpha-like protein
MPGTPARISNTISHEKIVEEWKKREKEEGGKKKMNLVVVGHVDAGKSTLMGKILHELGALSDKEHSSNERASAKMGKGSFAYAWALDSSQEERERGVTIDIAQDSFATENRQFTLLDAPGHRDFIPNMITGAAQADVALLVIDAIKGAFEAGFGQTGQTREHAILVRSLGVQQLVVVVNKIDALDHQESRFTEIVDMLRPFLTSTGFDQTKIAFVPCGAAAGENLSVRRKDSTLSSWYSGPTLVEVLDQLNPPVRQLDAPLRIPITNVFRAGQTAISSGIGVSGRLLTGVVSVGDRLCVVPGDESGIIKAIEYDNDSVPWAVAGSSVTIYLANIEINFINIGAVLCPQMSPVTTTTSIIAQILVFEPSLPILAGSTLDLYHHSSHLSVIVTDLIATLDMKTGAIIKKKPRVLSRGSTAKVQITFSSPIAMEPFSVNRDLGRILLRLGGETVAGGIVLEV